MEAGVITPRWGLDTVMFLHIDPTDGLAIYDQVVRQITFAVASGALRAGEFVPSVREMARELAINPNTVARAYRQLRDDGVLERVRGTGLAVTRGAAARCRKQRLGLITDRVREVLREARRSQLTRDDVGKLLEKELNSVFREDS